jgi:trk system potassium uptake protein TrkH
MHSFQPVLAVLGMIVAVFGLTMAVPLGVAWVQGDAALGAFARTMAVTVAGGLALWGLTRRRRRELQPRDGVLLVVLTWTVLPLFGCVPLMAYSAGTAAPVSFTDAYFEAASGLTTSGGTVLSGLDALPPSINVWRCFLQWLGGMGILVLAVAILPLLGVGGSQLFKAESAGPLKDTKLTPRITETAKGLWSVYAVMSLACVTAYWLAGMPALDAWMHMFATVSLGGLSSHDASFGHFASPRLEAIAIVFMLIASCNFAMYFVAVRKRSLRGLLHDVETRATLGVMVGGGLVVAAVLVAAGTYEPATALRHAMFNVVSIASTTGFATVDYLQWPALPPVLMLLLSGVATSAGSTGGGIKMVRLLILLKQARRELTRLIHPRAVQPLQLGGRTVDSEVIFAVLGFMLVYGGTVLGLTLLMLLPGNLDLDSAMSAVIASINCMGPGLGTVGPAANFGALGDFQTWVLTAAMLLGRLELLVVLVLLTPQFWRK